jgi:hypothetical protein
MTSPLKADWTPGDVTNLCIDFGLPVLVILVATLLLMTGVDGEVKTMLTLAAGWIFHSGYTRKRAGK